MSSAFGGSGLDWRSHPLYDAQRNPMPMNAPTQYTTPYFANAVYYPSWKVYRKQPPSSLSLAFISHIFYAFAWPNPDGTISLSDEHADLEIEVDRTQGCISALTNLKHRHPEFAGIRIILSIGGSGQGSRHFAGVAGNATARKIFATSAKDLVHQYGFDGVDIDWEHPANAQEGADYIQLLADTRSFLPSPRFTMTSALPAGQWALDNINLAMASAYVDFINLMGYDFSGPWVDRSGHQAQLYSPIQPHNEAATVSCDSAVRYMSSRGVPPRKILLGIPAYGRSFLGAGGIGQHYHGQPGEFEYRDLPRPGAQEYVDVQVGAAFSVGGDGGFVTYDNHQTVRMKAEYVREFGLAGLFYWTGTGDLPGPRSLVENGFNALHSI